MAAFEKGKRDNQNPLFLAKIAKRVLFFLLTQLIDSSMFQ